MERNKINDQLIRNFLMAIYFFFTFHIHTGELFKLKKFFLTYRV